VAGSKRRLQVVDATPNLSLPSVASDDGLLNGLVLEAMMMTMADFTCAKLDFLFTLPLSLSSVLSLHFVNCARSRRANDQMTIRPCHTMVRQRLKLDGKGSLCLSYPVLVL